MMSSEVPTAVAPAVEAPEQHTPRRIDDYLLEVLKKGGSDLHMVAGDPPRIRLNGDLQTLRDQRLGQEQTREIIYEMMTRRALHQLEEKDGADFAYMIPGVSRFRVNVFRHIGGLGSVMRAIPSQALTLEQLNMPNAVRSLAPNPVRDFSRPASSCSRSRSRRAASAFSGL
jgi:twitching motility protein PilT